MADKTIMLLGAGPFQVPGIMKARALGYRVITVDYFPDNPGHRYSDRYVNCSTVDRQCVLHAAREFGVDGVCTFSSDVALPTVGYVCDQLGLPGVSQRAAEIMATKHRFRGFLRDNGMRYPRFVSGARLDDLFGAFDELRFPVIVKPVDTSGSRGVSQVQKKDVTALRSAFEYSQHYSRSKTVCVEEFIEGTEVGGDGILGNGCFEFIAITRKHMRGFVVMGHQLPTGISPKDQQCVVSTLEQCCQALGYLDGPLNFDLMVGPRGATIIEMSARNGGNGLPQVINRGTGVDVEVQSLRLAMGEAVDVGVCGNPIRGCGSYVFGSPASGTLKSVASAESIIAEISEVFDVSYALQAGDAVAKFENNSEMIGYALFDCPRAEDYVSITTSLEKALRIDVVDRAQRGSQA